MNYLIPAHELPYLSLITVAVDINVETLKENRILLSQFAQNVVEACFLRNITG